jgi:hypothetical protein
MPVVVRDVAWTERRQGAVEQGQKEEYKEMRVPAFKWGQIGERAGARFDSWGGRAREFLRGRAKSPTHTRCSSQWRHAWGAT